MAPQVPTSVELVSKECPECGDLITGKAKGGGSVDGKLALHRANRHGYRNAERGRGRRQTRGRQREGGDSAHPVLALVDTAREELGDGKAPDAAALSRALGRMVNVASVAVASYAAETDPRDLTDSQREGIVTDLSLRRDAAEDLMAPIGRSIARSKLNAKYGKGIVENVETVTSVAEVAKLVMHWRRYFRERDRAAKGFPPPPHVASYPGAVDVNGPAMAPVVDPANQGVIQEQMEGRVLSQEDIARMRAGASA